MGALGQARDNMTFQRYVDKQDSRSLAVPDIVESPGSLLRICWGVVL